MIPENAIPFGMAFFVVRFSVFSDNLFEDVKPDESLHNAECGNHTERRHEIRLSRDKTNRGRACENAEIAHRADGGDRRTDGHDALPTHERKEYGHNIRAADADGKESEIEECVHRREHDEQNADEGKECTTDGDRELSDALNDVIAKEAHEEHRPREYRESHPREREIHAAHRRQVDTAPIHDRALTEEGNERCHADKGDNAARNRNERAAAPAAIGDEMSAKHRRQCEHQHRCDQRRLKRREPRQTDPHTIQPRADEAAKTPESVHTAHDAQPNPLLHDDRRNIHDDIHTAHQAAKEEDHGHGHPKRIHKADREQARRV